MINYPFEEKCGILIFDADISHYLDDDRFYAEKRYDMKYGSPVFETFMQRDISIKYCKKSGELYEIAGLALGFFNVGDTLLMIDNETETEPKLFYIKEILFRQKSVNGADPAMRGYIIRAECQKYVFIKQKSRFVKVNI